MPISSAAEAICAQSSRRCESLWLRNAQFYKNHPWILTGGLMATKNAVEAV